MNERQIKELTPFLPQSSLAVLQLVHRVLSSGLKADKARLFRSQQVGVKISCCDIFGSGSCR